MRSVAVSLRLAERKDAEALRSIYNLEVEESTVTFDLVARTLEEQIVWIDEHQGAHPAIVAVDDAGEVVGFGALQPYRPRPGYTPTLEDSIYVRRERQREGIGKILLAELLKLAEAHGFHSVIARIVCGHTASIELHRQCGYAEIGVEKEVGRKFNTWLDVVLMQRML